MQEWRYKNAVQVGAEDAARYGLQTGALVLESTLAGTPSSSQDALPDQVNASSEEAAVRTEAVLQLMFSDARWLLSCACIAMFDHHLLHQSIMGPCEIIGHDMQESQQIEADMHQTVKQEPVVESDPVVSHKRLADANEIVSDQDQQLHIDKRIKLEV